MFDLLHLWLYETSIVELFSFQLEKYSSQVVDGHYISYSIMAYSEEEIVNRTIKLPAWDVLLSQVSTSHASLWWHPQFTRLKGARWGPWGMMVHSDAEVFPLLQFPRGELYSEVAHCIQTVVALGRQGILSDVELFQGFCSLDFLHLDI